MALFLQEDVSKLLWNKFVVVLGDSNQRSVYKDLVNLIQMNSYTRASDLKTKGELSFMDDQLLHGGRKGKMMNGVNYREVRQYKTDYHLIRFYFVTRVYNDYVQSIWDDLSVDPKPDVIIMNSCLWDVSRYGPTSMNKYKTNIEKSFRAATDALPPECLFIWNTALPVANKIRGGFLLPELDFLCSTLRLDVLEGNFYAKELATAYGLDVLDLHYFFRFQLHRRAPDGVHWNHQAHRRITNLILTHVASAWGLDPPRHVDELSRSLPAVEERPTKTPTPPPDPLGFIDFNKPAPGSAKPKLKARSASTPAALGKMPDEESRSLTSSVSTHSDQNGNIRSDKSNLHEQHSRPKSADGHQMSVSIRDDADRKRPSSVDGSMKLSESSLKIPERYSNSGKDVPTENNRPRSAENFANLPSENNRPRSADNFANHQPGLLGSPPKHNSITSIVKSRNNNRFAPYNNNNRAQNNKPPAGVFNGPTNYSAPMQNVNVFNNVGQFVNVHVPPPNFNMAYQNMQQAGFQAPAFQGQYQADLEWRRQQRMNRMMHERGMELNWFGGYNW